MADGRHLGKIEKLLYLSRGLSDIFGTMMQFEPLPLLWLVAFTTACTTVQAVM